MIDRKTKICHKTKLALVCLMSASPSESASTVKRMTATANGILSLCASARSVINRSRGDAIGIVDGWMSTA
ncbi:MAG: hypothetical protein ACR2RE_29610 [Geminicoccaceae bacterium]